MKRLILINFALFFIITTRAQNHIIFHHLTVENGLSQNSVTCIFQDAKGFMWFGSQDGLNRFDGYNIKVFKNNSTDTTSLINNFIFSIYEDTAENMYVETQGGGFQKYNPITESFIRLSKNKVNLKGARFNSLNALFNDTSVIEWTGGMSKATGLKRTDKRTGKITIYKYDPLDKSSISSDKVYSVYRDHSDNLWIGTFNGLDKLNERNNKFIHYRNKPNDPNSLSQNWVWPIYEDSQGYLWIGTVGGGLNRFNPNSETFINFKNDRADPRSLSNNFIISIYEDRSGVIWIGTNGGGVNYFLPSAQVFNLFTSIPGNNDWLEDNSIQSIYSDKNGIYWIGTQNKGLYKFNYNKNIFKNYVHNPNSSNSISSNTIQSIYEDRAGNLWIGNFSSGLDEYKIINNTFKHYENNTSDPYSLSDNRIYSIIQDKKGFIWIGTYGGGLNKLNPETGKIIRFQYDENNPNSISSNAVWSIDIEHSGKLILGTFGGGINIFDPVKNTATHLKNIPDDPSSLISNNVIIVFVDSKNNIWAGTTKGLSKYDRKKRNFKIYREQEGLPNSTILGILEDNSGNIWVSTNKGLSRFNPKTGNFKNYYLQDGLQGNEFNQNAFAKDNVSGRLLFGGANGFNVFNPASIKGNKFLPPVVFTDFIRYNADDKKGKPIFEEGISEKDGIHLTHKDNIVIFQFAGLSYYNSSNNQYKYKLEGFNKNWIQLGNEHSVTFTNLSPGKYKLKVLGANNDGLWNKKPAALFIEVTPPWWKTNFAYGSYILAFLGILFATRRFELNRREEKARMRENELRLKATEAEKRAIEAENERKTKELEEARKLQLSMLPKELPKLPNMEIEAFMKTATEVGGDYYDFIAQDDGLLNIGFGDATGHGLQAGTMVTLMKGFFTSNAVKLEPLDFMNHCTALIKEIELGRILMSFSFLKIKDGKLLITSGGMPPLYYYNKQINEIEELMIQGMPLGAMKHFSYKVIEKELKPGDTLLLLTDGLPEQMNNNEEMLDYHRVKSHFKKYACKSPKEIINALINLGDDWMGNNVQADDITFVVIKIK